MSATLRARAARLVPCTFFAAALLALWGTFRAAKGPSWLGSNADPAYPYLLNALNLLHGFPPGHVDHPGTPLQALVAAVVWATHAFAGAGDLADDVIRRPERFLGVASWVLLVLYAAALAISALAAWSATQRIGPTIAMALAPVLSATAIEAAVCVKPEPLLLTLSAALSALVMRHVHPARPQRPLPDAALFGIVIGVAAATKITAAPIALLPFLLLRGARQRLLFLAASAAAFALATRPAWSAFSRFREIMARIATHSGVYGYGPASVLDPAQYATGLRSVAADNPPLVAIIIAGAAIALLDRLLGANRDLERATRRRALLACVAAQAASILFVARHARSYYVAPALGLTGASLALGLWIAGRWEGRARLAHAAVIAIVLAVASREIAQIAAARGHLDSLRAQQLEVARRAAQEAPGAAIIRYYGASAPEYALHFGNVWSDMRWSRWIGAAHPGAAFYDIWARKLEGYRPLRPPTAPDGRPAVLVQGTPIASDPHMKNLTASFLGGRPDPVLTTEVEGLYRLSFPPGGPREAGTAFPTVPFVLLQ